MREAQFWFGVRCRMGRWFAVCFTGSLITFCFAAYMSRFIVPLLHDGHVAVAAICATLMTLCYATLMMSFARACGTHPGRLPTFFEEDEMNKRVEEAFHHVCGELHLPSDLVSELRTRYRVGVTSVAMVPSMRYCDLCRVYKCSTTHHCSSCGTCVFELDHHCPWVGVCIGRSNHKYFLLFLLYTVVSAVVLVASSANAVIGKSGIQDTMLFGAWIVAVAFALILTPFLFSAAQTVHHNTSTIAKMQLRRRGTAPQRRLNAQAPPYAAVHVDESDGSPQLRPSPVLRDDDDASRSGLAGGTPSMSVGLRRIMGVGSVFPNWLLPVQPQFVDPEDQWEQELTQEVFNQVEYHMTTTVAVAQQSEQLRRANNGSLGIL